MSLGDFAPAAVADLLFCTADGNGAPTTLGGTPAISAYKANSLTQSTAGITLDADFDGVTGLNHVRVDTSADGTFYAAGNEFSLVITGGTVGGNSAVGYVVGVFSLGHGASYGRLGAPAGASVSADIATVAGYVDTEVAAIKAKTDNLPADPAATSDIPTAATVADALLDRTDAIETGWTVRKILRVMAAAIAGKASGLDTNAPVYRDVTDSKDRITATTDANGNRSAVTLDGS